MTPPTEPFEQRFDSIEVDPATAPTRAAIEHALAICEPCDAPAGRPGFRLLDDACGRFTVDREFGVVSLRDEALLAREHGQIHTARLHVIEPSGASYELELRLRVTGVVPHMVGCEDDLGLNPRAAASVTSAPSQSAPLLPWARFAAAKGERGKAPLDAAAAPLGAILAPDLPAIAAAGLTFVRTTAAIDPASARAAWPD